MNKDVTNEVNSSWFEDDITIKDKSEYKYAKEHIQKEKFE